MENYITNPQNESPPRCPTQAILYTDIKNMFNCVSREELMNIIAECFPELLPLAHLTWCMVKMERLDTDDMTTPGNIYL